MHYNYTPTGVHSKSIEFDIEDNIVKNVKIIGGCDGNNKGMAALAEGRTTDDVIRLLSGIPCGNKPTSCPDQLAKAVAAAVTGYGRCGNSRADCTDNAEKKMKTE